MSRQSVKWVIYTSVTLTGVLIAATAQRWDLILAASWLCFARGVWGARQK